MSLAVVMSRALDGLQAPPVHVEVQLANGLPSFTLVGLADTEVKESRERVRAALQQSGFAFPHNKRITVNLAPADLPKESGRFDLPIALGILAAAARSTPQPLAACEICRRAVAGRRTAARCAAPWRWRWRCAARPARSLVLPAESAAAPPRWCRGCRCAPRAPGRGGAALLPGDAAQAAARARRCRAAAATRPTCAT
jgi:magnesium chelatase family protein